MNCFTQFSCRNAKRQMWIFSDLEGLLFNQKHVVYACCCCFLSWEACSKEHSGPNSFKQMFLTLKKQTNCEYDEVCREAQLWRAFCFFCRAKASASLLAPHLSPVIYQVESDLLLGGAGWGVGLKDGEVEVGVGGCLNTHCSIHSEAGLG